MKTYLGYRSQTQDSAYDRIDEDGREEEKNTLQLHENHNFAGRGIIPRVRITGGRSEAVIRIR